VNPTQSAASRTDCNVVENVIEELVEGFQQPCQMGAQGQPPTLEARSRRTKDSGKMKKNPWKFSLENAFFEKMRIQGLIRKESYFVLWDRIHMILGI